MSRLGRAGLKPEGAVAQEALATPLNKDAYQNSYKHPTPAMLSRLNQNISALKCAIEETSTWIDQQGSRVVSERINEQMRVLENNNDAIAELLVDLIARWTPEEEKDPED